MWEVDKNWTRLLWEEQTVPGRLELGYEEEDEEQREIVDFSVVEVLEY